MKVRRLKSQHSTYPRLFSQPRWEPDSARPILELFHTGNNPTDPASMLDKTHEDIKNKNKTNWRDTTQMNLDTPTKTKAHIQHAFKENSKIWENNSERFTRMIQAKW
jgi:hypothetical protein